MKKIFSFLLTTVLLAGMAACGNPSEKLLKAQIESGEKACPISMGMAGKISAMSYDEAGKTVDFTVTLNKDVSDIKDFQADPEAAKTTLRMSLQKGDLKKLLEMMKDAGAGLTVTYRNKGSEGEFTVGFTADEIKDMVDNPMSEKDADQVMLSSQIRMEKKKIPYRIADGLTITGIEDNGRNLVYVCAVDEDDYDIDEMGNAKEELKGNMRKMMRDRAMRRQAEVLASLDKGFEYKYVGSKSGKEVTVGFTPAELKEISGARGHK